MIYCILLGRIYNYPEGKSKRGVQGPIRRCPTSLPPPIHVQLTAQHRAHPTLRIVRGFFSLTFKELWDGSGRLSSLYETTKKSDHLQMKLQRQHFLLSCLKTLSVGFICMWMKTNFHMKGWAPRLALKTRPKVIRKWSINKWIATGLDVLNQSSIANPEFSSSQLLPVQWELILQMHVSSD